MRGYFVEELERLINRESMENESNTPDFILAAYLANCLSAFSLATNMRERWYGRMGGRSEESTMLLNEVRKPTEAAEAFLRKPNDPPK